MILIKMLFNTKYNSLSHANLLFPVQYVYPIPQCTHHFMSLTILRKYSETHYNQLFCLFVKLHPNRKIWKVFLVHVPQIERNWSNVYQRSFAHFFVLDIKFFLVASKHQTKQLICKSRPHAIDERDAEVACATWRVRVQQNVGQVNFYTEWLENWKFNN